MYIEKGEADLTLGGNLASHQLQLEHTRERERARVQQWAMIYGSLMLRLHHPLCVLSLIGTTVATAATLQYVRHEETTISNCL